jgi:hypothetical protein
MILSANREALLGADHPQGFARQIHRKQARWRRPGGAPVGMLVD